MSWPNKFELSLSPSICMCTYAFHKLNRLFRVTFYFDLIVWAKKKPWQSNRQIGHFGANLCAFSYEIQNLLCHLVDAIDQKKMVDIPSIYVYVHFVINKSGHPISIQRFHILLIGKKRLWKWANNKIVYIWISSEA